MNNLSSFAQAAGRGGDSNGIGLFLIVTYIALLVFMVASFWKVYQKAGKPGWAAIVPIYNSYVLLKIAGRPGWWLLLYFIPIVNFVVQLIVSVDVAKSFGRSAVFGVFGLGLFSFIGFPILAFGDDTYKGAAPVNLTA